MRSAPTRCRSPSAARATRRSSSTAATKASPGSTSRSTRSTTTARTASSTATTASSSTASRTGRASASLVAGPDDGPRRRAAGRARVHARPGARRRALRWRRSRSSRRSSPVARRGRARSRAARRRRCRRSTRLRRADSTPPSRRRAAASTPSTKTRTARSTAAAGCSSSPTASAAARWRRPRAACSSPSCTWRSTASRSTPSAVATAMLGADRTIAEAIARVTERPGAATVALCAPLDAAAAHWLVAWVGDCRVYRWSARGAGQLDLLTRDDTFGHLGEAPPPGGSPHDPARMVGNGATTGANAAVHAIGRDDLLVLCSDGVHKHLDGADWCAVLAAPVLAGAARPGAGGAGAEARQRRRRDRAAAAPLGSRRAQPALARPRRPSVRQGKERAMTPADIDRVFGRGRLRMVTGDHVEVFREHSLPGERRRYTKRFLATAAGDFSEWTEREWRILARLVGHGIKPVPDVVHFDRGAADRPALVQTFDAGVTVDHWATLAAARARRHHAAQRLRGLRPLVGARAPQPDRARRHPRAAAGPPRPQGRQRLHSGRSRPTSIRTRAASGCSRASTTSP